MMDYLCYCDSNNADTVTANCNVSDRYGSLKTVIESFYVYCNQTKTARRKTDDIRLVFL